MSIVLTGGQFSAGQATRNNQTDSYLVLGAGNTILTPGGGNLSVTGVVSDTGTMVFLGGLNNPQPNQFNDNITINLDGDHNEIESLKQPSFTPGGVLWRATVNATVSGAGGFNTVNLQNWGGHTTLNLNGPNNSVTLNGNATNSVTLGGGNATVQIGTLNDNGNVFNSTVNLAGGDNVVKGGSENFTISNPSGTGGDSITLGNGNDTITDGGNGNTIKVGDGNSNSITANGNSNNITVGSGSNTISATGNNETITIHSGDKLFPTGPSVDNILLGGTGDSVTEVSAGLSASSNVSVFGSTGTATINLLNGNDSVNAGGNNNEITLGNGVNTVTANGNGNIITVGQGSNSISDTGSGSTITLNGNNHSQDSTVVGNSDTVNANNGVQAVSAQDNDLINLSNTALNSALTFGGVNTLAFLKNDGDVNATYNASGHGNDLQIIADAAGTYTGHSVIDGLIPGNGALTFQGFTGADATLNSPFGALMDFFTHPVSGGYQITTAGGGTITLHATQGLSLSMFT